MSKHSMRSGSASSRSASCRSSSASTRCWRERSAFRRSWSSASRALRSASDSSRALSPRSAARTSTLAPRRSDSSSASGSRSSTSAWTMTCGGVNRGLAVVLQQELLGDLAHAALLDVVQVERLAVAQHAVAQLEDLGVGVGAVGGHRDDVDRAVRVVGDALALQERPHGRQPVALQRGLLELLLGGRVLHPRLEVALDLAIATGQERAYAVDRLHVLRAVHAVVDARCPAALDVVVEARRARPAPRLRAVARAVLEHLAQRLERRARALRAGVGAEVQPRLAMALTGEVDARERLVHRDRDVRIGLVV